MVFKSKQTITKTAIDTQERKAFQKKVEILIRAVDKIYPSMKVLMFRSFVQGIFVALGSTVGLALVLGILAVVLHQLQAIPIIDQAIKNTQLDRVIEEQQRRE
jgi:hypothetical protein